MQLKKNIISSSDDEEGIDAAMNRVIDWNALKKINPDIIGWIYIPDTQIDYPILRHHTDINYYLNHTYEKKYNVTGSIFTRPEQKSLKEIHTVLFGHNMNSGYMFGDLQKYTEQEFSETHAVYVYTPEDVRKYEAFAVYGCKKDDETYQLDINPSEYVQSIREKSKWFSEDTMTRNQNCQILTLSTCPSYGSWKNRFVVQCLRTDIRRYGDAQAFREKNTENFEKSKTGTENYTG